MSDNNIYIYANKDQLVFEDYITSINQRLKGTIIHDKNKIKSILNKNNIIIFIYEIPELDFDIDNTHNNIFIVNTEQLTIDTMLEKIINFSKKYYIIDYSRENIDIMNKNNIFNTIYFPYIYNKDENYNLKVVTKEKKVLNLEEQDEDNFYSKYTVVNLVKGLTGSGVSFKINKDNSDYYVCINKEGENDS